MSGQNWRTEVNAQDYLGHQKKRVELEQRRPVIRKASDLVGPGIGSEAVRITDYNDILATFNGYYSSAPGALNAPSEDEPFVGTTVSDPVLGGKQSFVGLESAYEYTRTFVRNASDASAISWGVWEATERVPASATSREAVDTPGITSQGSHLLRPPRISTIGAAKSYSRTKSDIYVLRPGVYAGYLRIEGPSTPNLKLNTISVIVPDRDNSKTLTFGPLRCKSLTSIPFTFWTTGESQEIRVYVSHNNATPQTITWKDFTIVRVGDVPAPGLAFEGAFAQGDGGTVIGDPDPGAPDVFDDIQFWQDEFVLTSDGAQTLGLSHDPLPNSEHVYWNGLYQRENVAWTRAGFDLSLLVGAYAPKTGDRVSVEYAYEKDSELPFVPVAFESPDWRYLIVGETDMIDRSAVSFDDSSWTVGKAAFGWPMSQPPEHVEAGLPLASTPLGNTNVGVWMRRAISIPGAIKQVSISARVDGLWALFFDGVSVASGGGVLSTAPVIVKAPSGPTVVALHVWDDVSDPSGDWIYADVEITEA